MANFYQQGTLSMILPLDQLLEACELTENSALLCGTLAAIGGVRPAEKISYGNWLIQYLIEESNRPTGLKSLPIIA